MKTPNLAAPVLERCAKNGAAQALVASDVALSYAELGDRADSLAGRLHAAGIEPDEPVLVPVSNVPDDFVAFLGVWQAGGVVVPVHRASPASVVQEHLEATRVRLIARMDGPIAADGSWRESGDLLVARVGAPTARAELAGAALVIFTSGSTGHPKGVVQSHRALAGKLAAIDSLLHFECGEPTLLVLNITFSFGIWVSLLTLVTGGTLLMQRKFTPRAFCAAVAANEVARVAVVPTMMRALFADPPAELAAAGRSTTLRQILIGGESLGRALAAELATHFPRADLIDIYGLTETATSDFFLLPEDQSQFAGCIGRPSPQVEFRIAAADGSAVAPGEVGELQIRTPFIMNGYLDAPELTAAAFQDGWFRTGDMGRVREGGVVELAGRAKELISRGGNKISPLELEQVFAAHPDVAAAMAAGAADPILGERIHVLVVPRPGRLVTQEALRQHATSRLPKFRQPDAYHIADALPLGRTGKADRGALKAMIERGSPDQS
ncbi:MAG: acyl--CoA ligase [Betaproteobacteria bacterium]|nr:acyl--CoA ligase [Betaproteobacteria bacterium]